MIKNKFINEAGFTLIEIIVSLILIAIVSVALSGFIVYGVKNYIFARDAGQMSQRAQLALVRINKELIDATAITTANSNQVTYTSSTGDTYDLLIDNTNHQITLNKNSTGAQILINGLTTNNGGNNFLTFLQTDGVTAWTTALAFSQLARIQVRITLDIINGGGNLDFQTSINPRENNFLNAPRLLPQ